MAIEIVSFPIKNGDLFHSYVKLPEGSSLVQIFGCLEKTLGMLSIKFFFWDQNHLPLRPKLISRAGNHSTGLDNLDCGMVYSDFDDKEAQAVDLTTI